TMERSRGVIAIDVEKARLSVEVRRVYAALDQRRGLATGLRRDRYRRLDRRRVGEIVLIGSSRQSINGDRRVEVAALIIGGLLAFGLQDRNNRAVDDKIADDRPHASCNRGAATRACVESE